MKKILPLVLLILTSTAASQVNYEIYSDEDTAAINRTILLSCDEAEENCPVNSWRLQWNIGSKSEIVNIEDSLGELTDYSREEGTVTLETNQGDRRNTEKIQIDTRTDREAEEVVDGLKRRQFNLSGFPGRGNSGTAEVENMVSAWLSPDFNESFSQEKVTFSGRGAGTLILNSGRGYQTKNYEFFGAEKDGETAYRVAVGTTGLVQQYDRIPVAVLEEENYMDQVASWSRGEYSSGVIKLRDNLSDGFQPVLAEETAHALNSEALEFDQTDSSYLDEGIAGYVRFLTRKKLYNEGEIERPPREIFGNETRYGKSEDYYYEIPSEGKKEVLWNYYQDDRDFMKSWNPSTSSENVRNFGYAYSELIVRNHVATNGSVKQLLSRLGDREIRDANKKWSHLSQYVDLTPCDYESRQRFNACLKKVNSYDYPVYYADQLPDTSGENVSYTRLQIPERREEGDEKSDFRNRKLYEQGFLSSVVDFLSGILGDLL